MFWNHKISLNKMTCQDLRARLISINRRRIKIELLMFDKSVGHQFDTGETLYDSLTIG